MEQLDRMEKKIDNLTEAHNNFKLDASVRLTKMELKQKQTGKIFGGVSGAITSAIVTILVSILLSKMGHAEQLKNTCLDLQNNVKIISTATNNFNMEFL